MRRYTTVCIDNETNREIVLSDCSYNQACSYLNEFGIPDAVKTDPRNRNITYIEINNKTFLYDEHRGLLLKER